MRFIFVFLLLLNVSIAVWGLFLKHGSDASSRQSDNVSAQLVSLGDSRSEEQQNRQSVDAQVPSIKRLCELVGPFGDDEQAGHFVERLRSIDIAARIDYVDLPASTTHWVYLPPEETTVAAFRKLSELQAQDIESYVIGKGDLANAISLGVFSVERLAGERVKALEALGLNPLVKQVQRADVEIWVALQPEQAQKISGLTWDRLLKSLPEQERRQNFCLPVAS